MAQDLAAANALSQYPEQARETVVRCTRRLQKAGWSIVKACADRQIEAEKATRKD